MFSFILKKIHCKLERMCVKHACIELRARRDKKDFHRPFWFKYVSKYEFKLRTKLYFKKEII